MKSIVIITIEYPYGRGESFLDQEITYLAAAFDSITIISRARNREICRDIPENCSVLWKHPVNSPGQNIWVLLLVLRRLPLFISLLFHEMHDLRKHLQTQITLRRIRIAIHDLGKALQMARYIEKTVPDYKNHLYYSYWLTNMALTLAILRKTRKVRAISRVHRHDLYFYASDKGYISFQRYKFANLNKVFFISEHGLKYALDFYRLDRKSPTLEISRLGTLTAERPTQAQNPDPDVKKMVSCAFLSPVKRIDLLIEALSIIDHLKIIWYHIGSGPDATEFERKAEHLLGGKSNIQVIFLGYLSNREVHSFYTSTHLDLFINVSQSEGIPVSIMEAISYGIPVIATRVGGTEEIINHESGILLSPDPDAEEVSGNIVRLLEENQENRRKLAFQTWQQKFNADINYPLFIKSLDNECF